MIGELDVPPEVLYNKKIMEFNPVWYYGMETRLGESSFGLRYIISQITVPQQKLSTRHHSKWQKIKIRILSIRFSFERLRTLETYM